MSHEIEQPIDKVLSIKGTEWHGLAEHLEFIDKQVLQDKGLLFPIGKSQVINWHGEEMMQEKLRLIGETIARDGTKKADILKAFEAFSRDLSFIDSHQTVIGDLTNCRPDLVKMGMETRIPLGIPKKSYEIITNESAFDTIGKVFPNCNVSTAGTLRGGKVFFVSLDLDGQSEYVGPRGDKYLQFIEVITSHDGTLGCRVYDSGTRIVCMNTLKASLSGKGELDMVVYHSKNAQSALDNVSVSLEKIFSSRAEFFSNLEILDTVKRSPDEVRYIVSSFLNNRGSREGEEPTELSTQTYNKADEIAALFGKAGMGNRGENDYDLLNGLTECYTWGSGTGKKSSKQEKFLKSRDGTASEIKEEFYNFLLSGEEFISKAIAQGEKLYKEKGLVINK